MNILFSKHALFQLRERKIRKIDVIACVKNPDSQKNQSWNRRQAIKNIKRGKKPYLLIVVYDYKGSTFEIVTAFITSKLKKYI